jgi:hypothetical protein
MSSSALSGMAKQGQNAVESGPMVMIASLCDSFEFRLQRPPDAELDPGLLSMRGGDHCGGILGNPGNTNFKSNLIAQATSYGQLKEVPTFPIVAQSGAFSPTSALRLH